MWSMSSLVRGRVGDKAIHKAISDATAIKAEESVQW